MNSQEQNGTSITITGLYFDGAIKGLQDDENLVIAGFRGITENGEEVDVFDFLLLYYNQTKKCFFGYGRREARYILCELFFFGTDEKRFTRKAVEDASIYGF